MQSAEQAQASLLRSSVAPVLANGVVCAMRDQPADPAGYMAEYLAAAGAGGASAVLDKRKFGQECARLDAELESLNEQLVMARAERARRLPESSDAEALRNAAVSAAAWSETRRLKRLMRSMKDGRRLRLALAPGAEQHPEVAPSDFTVTIEVGSSKTASGANSGRDRYRRPPTTWPFERI